LFDLLVSGLRLILREIAVDGFGVNQYRYVVALGVGGFAEVRFGLNGAQFGEGAMKGAFVAATVKFDPMDTVLEVVIVEDVDGGVVGLALELGEELAAAANVPGGVQGVLEEKLLEGAGGLEVSAEAGFEFAVGVFLARDDQRSLAEEAVGGGVTGDGMFAGGGFGAGGFGGVATVRGGAFGC